MRASGIIQAMALVASLAYGTGQKAGAIEFRLHDVTGREVRAQDYKGRPLLLEFGACW